MAGTPSTGWGKFVSRVIRGGITGVLLGVALHAGMILTGSNFHAVLPGEVYRCAQLSGPAMERYIRRHGIRTIVNLRGCCPGAAWYRVEAHVAAELNVSLEDINFSATRLPSPQALHQLVEVIESAEGPILFHCHQGADRTGLASVLAILLRTEATLDEGMRHLGLATGHLAIGRTRHVDRFFEFYAAYLAETDQTHSPDILRTWIRDHYCPAEGRARWTLLSPTLAGNAPCLHVSPEVGQVVTVRCWNTSALPWYFQPGTNAGIHLTWEVRNQQQQTWCKQGRCGLLRATVEPGDSIDLTIPMPGLPPGRYDLQVDLTDEQHGTFIALGNDPLIVEVQVP